MAPLPDYAPLDKLEALHPGYEYSANALMR